MAKWYGMIGYQLTVEDPARPGVYLPQIVEKPYYGDILQDITRWDPSATSQANDDISINNRLSVLIDAFAKEHLGAIRYVTFMGTRWLIKSVTAAYPRMTLDLGGVYNGPVPKAE